MLTSSSSCFSGDVHHCLYGVNCGLAFPKAELVLRETILADHVTLWSLFLQIISSRSFPIVSNRHIGLYDEASSRGLLPFLSRTNLCFFQSEKNLPSRRQELKTSRRISAYTPITSLRISFGNPSIPGAVFALSLPPTLFSSSRVKISSRWTTQELRACLERLYMRKQASHDVLDSIGIIQARGLSSSHQCDVTMFDAGQITGRSTST